MIYYEETGDGLCYWVAETNAKGGDRLRWSLIPRDHRKPTRRIPRAMVPKDVRRAAWYHLIEKGV